MRLPLAVAVVAALFVIAGVFDCAQVVHPDGWWPAGLGVLALLCAAYLLFRRDAGAYFRSAAARESAG